MDGLTGQALSSLPSAQLRTGVDDNAAYFYPTLAARPEVALFTSINVRKKARCVMPGLMRK